MGGERKTKSPIVQTAWVTNRRDNPYQFFLDDLLCDVTLTVSYGDDSHISMHNTVADDETKENIPQIDPCLSKVIPEKRSYKAHRLILACHSEYFHRMFVSCGMREVSGEVHLDWIDPYVLEAILRYIYTGQILESHQEYEENIELLSGIFLAADMFQMVDLEAAVLQLISKCCNPKNCLSLYLMVESLHSLATISAPALMTAKEEINVVLRETLKEQWSSQVIKSTAFLELELSQILSIISIKAKEEELAGDFSFSFVQSDIAEGIVAWVNHDMNERCNSVVMERDVSNNIQGGELSWWFCLHQLNASSRKNALNMINNAQKIISKMNSLEDASKLDNPTPQKIGDRFRESVNVDALCNGRLCPRRLHFGLLIIHAWTPHLKNSITADHVAYNFVRLEELERFPENSDINLPGKQRAIDSVLRAKVPYTLREFGELGVGEKHCILPNNVVQITGSVDTEKVFDEKESDSEEKSKNNLDYRKIGDRFRDVCGKHSCYGSMWETNGQKRQSPPYHMILTIDDLRFSGMVLDGVSRKSKCNYHHSVIYHYCPSAVSECGCTYLNTEYVIEHPTSNINQIGGHVSICSDTQGYVYFVSDCSNDDLITSDNDATKTTTHSSDFDPSCETFKLIKRNQSSNVKLMNIKLSQSSTNTEIVSGAMVIVIEKESDCIGTDKVLSNDSKLKFLVRFGGWKCLSFDQKIAKSSGTHRYIYCLYDLQEFHESTDRFNVVSQRGTGASDGSHFKSGHSQVVTKFVTLTTPPVFNSSWDIYDLQNKTWLDDMDDEERKNIYGFTQNPSPSSPSFNTGDSATVRIGQNLYVIGGYKVEHEKYEYKRGLCYQLPINDVWICDLKTMKWMAGPPLPTHIQNIPIGYFKGTAYSLPGNVGIVYSGGASLIINGSNSYYEYVPNTKVLMWRFDGTMHTNSWKVIYDVSDTINSEKSRSFETESQQKENLADYSIYAAIPTNACLPSFKVHRGRLVKQSFRKKNNNKLVSESDVKAPWLQRRGSHIETEDENYARNFSWDGII